MFEMNDESVFLFGEQPKKKKEHYWCVVFVGETNGHKHTTIVQQSEDCLYHDMFPDGAEDESLGTAWAKELGLYHIELKPWSYGPDMNGEYDCGVDAAKATCLYVYKPKVGA